MTQRVAATDVLLEGMGGDSPFFVAEKTATFHALGSVAHTDAFDQMASLWYELYGEDMVVPSVRPEVQRAVDPEAPLTHRAFQVFSHRDETHERFTGRIIGRVSSYITMSYWAPKSGHPETAGIVLTRQRRREGITTHIPDTHREDDHALTQVVLRPSPKLSRTTFMRILPHAQIEGQYPSYDRLLATMCGADTATLEAISAELRKPFLGHLLATVRKQRELYGKNFKEPLRITTYGDLSFLMHLAPQSSTE